MIHSSNYSTALLNWYNQPAGQALFKMEIAGLHTVLPTLFGYYLLQIGYNLNSELLKHCPIHHQMFLDAAIPTNVTNNFIQAKVDALPFIPESLDTVIIFHLLEFCSNPKKILAEIYQALIPGGTVVIFGFNPHSLIGMARWFNNSAIAPWSGKFISPTRMRKLFTKSGFDVGDYQTFYFRPITNNFKLLKKMLFLESIGQMFWPYFGSSYMFVAKKTHSEITPILTKAHTKEILIPNTQIARYDKNFSVKTKES